MLVVVSACHTDGSVGFRFMDRGMVGEERGDWTSDRQGWWCCGSENKPDVVSD